MIKNKTKKILIFIIFLNLFVINISFAHPGRTDSNGGHWDRSSGTYHYHTGEYAGQSSSSSSSSEKSSWEKYKEERQSNITKKYNSSTTSTNFKTDYYDLWIWVAIILAVLLFVIPFIITVLQLIVEFIITNIQNIKNRKNKEK